MESFKTEKKGINDPAVKLKNYLEITDLYDLKEIEDYEFLQSYGPIHYFPKNNAWLVTGYDEVKQILNDHVTFSAEGYNFNTFFDENNPTFQNGSKTIKNLFSKEFFENFENVIVEKSKEIIEKVSTKTKFDFNNEISKEIGIQTMCYVLGIKKSMIYENENYSEFL
jgi:cytochrome P450